MSLLTLLCFVFRVLGVLLGQGGHLVHQVNQYVILIWIYIYLPS